MEVGLKASGNFGLLLPKQTDIEELLDVLADIISDSP